MAGKQVMMFSYGSGCAASMFVLNFHKGYKEQVAAKADDYKLRLAMRRRVTAEEYDLVMQKRE